MASIVQQPNSILLPAYSNIIFAVNETPATINAAFYYRFVFRIDVTYHKKGATLLTTEQVFMRVVPNDKNTGIINIGNIVSNFCNTDTEDYTDQSSTIHNIIQYSKNRNNLLKVKVYFATEYSATALDQVGLSNFSLISEHRVFNGCQQLEQGLQFDSSPYKLQQFPDVGKFMTGMPSSVSRRLRITDYETVTFFSGANTNEPTSQPAQANFTFYDSGGVSLGNTSITNNAANGGGTPYNGNVDGLLYLGVGYQNILDSGYVIPVNTSYYEVQFVASDLVTPTSEIYTYEIQKNDCKGFETIRLTWLNRLGGWDYYNFTKKSTRTTNIKRELYTKNYGTWQGSDYSYNTWERGRGTLNTQATEIIECNTDFISEAEATALEELFTSPQVFTLDDAVTPVNVQEKSYTKQTTANDKLKQYVLSVEKAHNKRVQGL